MPDRNTTRGLLEQYFTTNWSSATPIAYQNVPFDDSAVTEYVQVEVMFVACEKTCIGIDRKRHKGLVYITIYTKQNSSSFRAFELSDDISNIMDNMTISSNLFTYSSNAHTEGAGNDGWYSVIVGVPFSSDEQ